MRQSLRIVGQVLDRYDVSSDQAQALLRVVTDYARALDILDDYDHQRVRLGSVRRDEARDINYEEAIAIVATLDELAGYVFLRDLKLLDAVTADAAGNQVAVALDKLYSGIDLAETLSCLTGKWVKRITRDTVEFEDGSTASLAAPAWDDVKPLVWW